MFDTHNHTNNSLDSTQTIDELCKKAIEKGLSGISITDHADLEKNSPASASAFERISKSVADADYAAKKYKNSLEVYKGVEISGYFSDQLSTKKILTSFDFDIVIGSVHLTEFGDIENYYSAIDFSLYNKEFLSAFISKYFDDLLELVDKADIDVVAHLTCPLRYINGKYKRNITLEAFNDKIKDIFRLITERDLSLEVNISGINGFYGDYMPTTDILKMYHNMGGKFITIGGDSHSPERVGVGFKEAKTTLKEIGFDNYCYYENRKKHFIRL